MLGKKLYLIAEIGVNHEGSIEKAKLLIDLAKKGGAHAAKFQSYKADKIASKNSPAYWDISKEPTKSQYDLFKKFDSFDEKNYIELYEYCKKVDIDFMSTPFDLEAVDFLNNLVSNFKLASADITNLPLLKKVASKNKDVILSTGCSTLKEIKGAKDILENEGAKNVVLLHCILNYPTLNENANLGMIKSLQDYFPNNHIGYSDHTLPNDRMDVLSMAYLMGCRVIEKHFTNDKNLDGNDHYHSMDYKDSLNFIERVNQMSSIIGLKEKRPISSEKKSIKYARRSIYSLCDIKKGQKLNFKNIICKRPGLGLSPMLWDDIIGKKAKVNILEDKPIDLNEIE